MFGMGTGVIPSDIATGKLADCQLDGEPNNRTNTKEFNFACAMRSAWRAVLAMLLSDHDREKFEI